MFSKCVGCGHETFFEAPPLNSNSLCPSLVANIFIALYNDFKYRIAFIARVDIQHDVIIIV